MRLPAPEDVEQIISDTEAEVRVKYILGKMRQTKD